MMLAAQNEAVGAVARWSVDIRYGFTGRQHRLIQQHAVWHFLDVVYLAFDLSRLCFCSVKQRGTEPE